MRTRCNYPGCPNNGAAIKNLSSAFKHSTHLVPKKHASQVARLLDIPHQKGARLFICSSHFRKGSFTCLRNGFRDVRPDVPFTDLLKLPGKDEAAIETKPVFQPISMSKFLSSRHFNLAEVVLTAGSCQQKPRASLQRHRARQLACQTIPQISRR